MSRVEKQDKLWEKITENTDTGSWHLGEMLIVPQDPVFDTIGDELQCRWYGCRKKTIHA